MKTHKDLEAWKEAMNLVEMIYQITESFPNTEIYGITGQLKRASISIPSNIAEGAGRKGEKEFIQFLYIALGSIAEVETQIFLSKRLGFIDDIDGLNNSIERVTKLIYGLIRFLKAQ